MAESGDRGGGRGVSRPGWRSREDCSGELGVVGTEWPQGGTGGLQRLRSAWD